MREHDIVVIGAGLTGLSTAHHLKKLGREAIILERENRVGGQVRTLTEQGFTFETGPNTGVVSFPEVTELFEDLHGRCQLEIARESSKRRLIWKGERFHALPTGLLSALTTPLFSWYDKIRILGEPWRKKGTDPDEPVGALAQRRLGKSYYEYAVDPFVSGVYAGDPMKLTTRYALPKLYNLEANYGSFICGAMAKRKEPKSERDMKATKKVFSAVGGLERIVEAMAQNLNIITGATGIRVSQREDGRWMITYNQEERIICNWVVTTVGAYELPQLLPFIEAKQMEKMSRLFYAPIIEVAVGLRDAGGLIYPAFGGLVPHKEHRDVLGILFPSECFVKRAPDGGMLFSYFIGGARHQEMMNKTDEEIKVMVEQALYTMLKYPADIKPDMIRIFRHQRAIPQYWKDSGERFETIEALQRRYPRLILAGNMRDGIGMANRIHQGAEVARQIAG